MAAAPSCSSNLAEADDAERERRREQLFEPQRTLVGHFRHESGRYYWSVLIAGSPWHERVRALFGDERADYAAALAAYDAIGPSASWGDECVTAYASAHPWEDWAETWTHLLHMTDSLETDGRGLRPVRAPPPSLRQDAVRRARGGRGRRRHVRHRARQLVPADVRAQLARSRPRPSRPLPVRPVAEGDREAAAGPRGDHRGPRGGRGGKAKLDERPSGR